MPCVPLELTVSESKIVWIFLVNGMTITWACAFFFNNGLVEMYYGTNKSRFEDLRKELMLNNNITKHEL